MFQAWQQLHRSLGISKTNCFFNVKTQAIRKKTKFIFINLPWLRRVWTLGVTLVFGISGAIVAGSDRTLAQVVGDTTLGAESSQVQTFVGVGFLIDGGATRGTNLFHSFSQFSVPTNEIAYFNNAATIQNIISRVIGPASNIDGILAANGTANLFLINPNGIIFGPNASLDIGGSFVASTANSINFADGTQFSTTNPQAAPLLTISVPLGVQFGSNPGSVQVQGAVLGVNPGQSLVIAGGPVSIDGGQLIASGGHVELGSVAAGGNIGLNINGNIVLLNFPQGIPRNDISITNGALVNVFTGDAGGGSIAVNARFLTIAGADTGLGTGIFSNSGVIGTQVGDIDLNATQAISIDGSLIANQVWGTGNSGNINITTGSLALTNGARLSASTFGVGDAGKVNITATDTVSLAGSYIYNNVGSTGIGNSGGINIATGSMLLTEGAQVDSSTYGVGNGGNTKINATGIVSLDGTASTIFSNVVRNAEGQGGDIEITAGSVSLTNGAQLQTITNGKGNAGNVRITTTDKVSLNGRSPDGKFPSAVFSNVGKNAVGNAGNIDITTGSVSLTNGASLNSSTFGQGDAGHLTITATDTVSFDGSDVFNNVEEKGKGEGGDINITADSLFLTNGSQLQTLNRGGEGNTGNIRISATDMVSLDGTSPDGKFPSAIFSTVDPNGVGNAGNIDITTGSLSLTNGAQLDSSTWGLGDAGNVKITALGTVSLDGTSPDEGLISSIFSNVRPDAVGHGGNIDISADSLSITHGAELSTSTSGQGNAGNVKITTTGTVSLDGTSATGQLVSAILSTVDPKGIGNAGSIDINTGSLSLTNGAQLDSSTWGLGDAGNVKITAAGTVSLDGTSPDEGLVSSIFSNVWQDAVGNGGNIDISADSLSLTHGAELVTSTFGQGNAGNVKITALGTVSLDGRSATGQRGSTIFSTVESTGVGNGGNIDITTGSLSLTNSGEIQTINWGGKGNAGNVRIIATDTVSLDSTSPDGQFISGISSAVFERGIGNGGNIDITTDSLSLNNKGNLDASNFGTGNAGTLTIVASDSIRLDNESTISADTFGGGGNINLTSPLIMLRHNSDISTNADGSDNTAGNITINTTFLFAVPKEDSDITANSREFRGGAVTVNASGGIFGLKFREEDIPESSDITAKGRDASLSGTVTLNTPIVDPSQGLVQLPITLYDPSNQIAVGCSAARGNSFTVTGRGGLPEDPTGTIRGQTVWRDLQDFSQGIEGGQASLPNPQALTTSRKPRLVEANSWKYDENGNVVLVAVEGNGTSSTYRTKPPECQDLSSVNAPKN